MPLPPANGSVNQGAVAGPSQVHRNDFSDLPNRRRGRQGRKPALGASRSERTDEPDVAAGLDVRAALARLPSRKLGISVGTVKSQTSKGMAELRRLLGTGATGELTEKGFGGRSSQATAGDR